MSEVLIQMKMPQCCEKCRFFAWKRGVGQHCAVDDRITFCATLDGFDVGYERNGDCPLVLVPPHGDLIDRGKVNLTDFEIVMCNGDYKEGMKMLLEKIESAPTIIPVEEK